jgi:Uma2 family endonuclease
MATVKKVLPKHRLVVYGVDWREYERFLRLFSRRPGVHLTYDRGVLEIMTLSYQHENVGHLVGRFILVLTEELDLPVNGGGSTTFRRRKQKRGLEPDECYWIQSEALVRGKDEINLRADPPPDLALEVDITRSSLNRLKIYASLGVPEVWRLERRITVCYLLGEDGSYAVNQTSRAIPGLRPAELSSFLALHGQMDENAIAREFRTWVREQRAAGRLGASKE